MAIAPFGPLADRVTQAWVQATGRRIDLDDQPWLEGPVGRPEGIGARYFDELARERGLVLQEGNTTRGLLPSLGPLRAPTFQPDAVHPAVRGFYERTSDYELESWAEWCGAFRPFGHLLGWLFSRRLQQLNVPLSPLDPSRGTTSRVIHLVDKETGQLRLSAWVRELRATQNVLYAGSYGITQLPDFPRPTIRVVFPLPSGNAQVHLRPEVDAEGRLTVVSSGERFGQPGFYFTVHRGGAVWARYVRAMREAITVYPEGSAEVRADHTLWLWGAPFLRLHYRLRGTRAAGV
jgi:hypothetical protein